MNQFKIQNSKFKIKDSHPQGEATLIGGFPDLRELALGFLPTFSTSDRGKENKDSWRKYGFKPNFFR
ncbi:MAG: hypothetical protein ACRAVC_19900 [Trichormus sp.]